MIKSNNKAGLVAAKLKRSERPVILLGTGRCASTWWQALLCYSSDIWIWGEHGGFLYDLINSNRKLIEHADLLSAGQGIQNYDNWHNFFNKNATELAWMNGFNLKDYDVNLAKLVARIFKLKIPKNKSRWGFKEIRYASEDNKVANFFLKQFPECAIVITLRHPRAVIESWVKVRQDFNITSEMDTARIKEMYFQELERVLDGYKSFINLKKQSPARVQYVFIEDKCRSIKNLEKFLGVMLKKDFDAINVGYYPISNEISSILEDLWSENANLLKPVIDELGYTMNDLLETSNLKY